MKNEASIIPALNVRLAKKCQRSPTCDNSMIPTKMQAERADVVARASLSRNITIELKDIVQAQRAISREIEVGRLIETLVTVAMNLVSAERGLLFLDRGRDFEVEAEGTTSDGIVRVALPAAFASSPRFPQSVLRYIVRLEETVVLDEALAGNQFSGDDYMIRERPCSLLCLPLAVQRNLVGALYLENAVAPHAFTPEKLAALELLASQAALLLKVAALSVELTHEVKERRAAEAELERLHRTKG